MKTLLSATAIALLLVGPAAAQQSTTAPTTGGGATVQTETTAPAGTAQQPGQVSADKLIGQDIENAAGENIGEINSVILSQDGAVDAVIVGVGGFLGLGEREIAIEWDDLQVSQDGEQITANYTEDQLREMPEYEYAEDQQRGGTFTRDGARTTAGAEGGMAAQPGTGGVTTAAPLAVGRDADTADTRTTTGAAGTTTTTTTEARTDTPAGKNELGHMSADEIIGQNVVNAQGEDVGEVEDLVMDQNQKVFAVVSVGGFLGMGAKDVAIPFEELQLGDDNVIMMSQADEDQLRQMPEYEEQGYQRWERQGPILDQVRQSQ